eukprot:gene58174-biopygen3302
MKRNADYTKKPDMPPQDMDTANVLRILRRIENGGTEGAVLIFVAGISDIRVLEADICAFEKLLPQRKYSIIPMHSTFTGDMQHRLFDVPESGTRKIIIATNIAETSITVQDVSFVIDTGRVKTRIWDTKFEMPVLVLKWVTRSTGDVALSPTRG